MEKRLEILHKYWKHNTFRPLQEEIIEAILDKKDTFVLLPTGGGKSVCFQIPALIKSGICIVISPLVSLINDQVKSLTDKGIKAIGLTGSISFQDMMILLDNCEFGDYKFLYLSPERLQNELVLERIKSLPVNQIVIDEAHCVSQWGHDFRPSYLKISVLKDIFSEIPFVALTATATYRVQSDIVTQLKLSDVAIFQSSFERKNIAYMVINTEDKIYKIIQILKKYNQSAIVYVRNRRACVDVSTQLIEAKFTATYYHGGLSGQEKQKNMDLWMTNKSLVMVATNAFGMGIDKADVKTVFHIQLPENLENYYQESGRAGRNGENAFAVLLNSKADSEQAKSQFIAVLPDKSYLKTVYNKLNNYFQIAYNEGLNDQFSFNLNHFCQKYQLLASKTYNAISFLDQQSVLSLSQEYSEKIKIQFLISSKEVIRYMSLNAKSEPLIMALIRSYSGIYDNPIVINIAMIAKKLDLKNNLVLELLLRLKTENIIDYISNSNDTTIIFNEIRDDDRTINRISKNLEIQNELKKNQLQSVIDFVNDDVTCKNRLLLSYFGESQKHSCGKCSYCIQKQNTTEKPNKIKIVKSVLEILKNNTLSSREIQEKLLLKTPLIIETLQNLLNTNQIEVLSNNKYQIKN